MTPAQPTARPWKIRKRYPYWLKEKDRCVPEIEGADETTVVFNEVHYAESKLQNWELIVRAVNRDALFEEMVWALEHVLTTQENFTLDGRVNDILVRAKQEKAK
jgi:hypothetical protein